VATDRRASPGSADLAIRGRIASLEGPSWGWVEGLAVRGGRVVAAGAWPQVEALVGPKTRRLTLAPDEVLIPGLTDAHLHLVDAAQAAGELDLEPWPTLAAGLAAVAELHRRLPADRWLLGRGWSVHRWGGWPTAADLDGVAPGRAVALWSHDHHALWASSLALDIAGVGPATPDPRRGEGILRAADGRPTGVLLERAAGLVFAAVPEPTVVEITDAVAAFLPTLLGHGIVGVQDPGGVRPERDLRRLDAYRRLEAAGRLAVRVEASVRREALEVALAAGLRTAESLGRGDRARVGWLKLFADGALGSRTAACFEPYDVPVAGPPTGLWQTPPRTLPPWPSEQAEPASQSRSTPSATPPSGPPSTPSPRPSGGPSRRLGSSTPSLLILRMSPASADSESSPPSNRPTCGPMPNRPSSPGASGLGGPATRVARSPPPAPSSPSAATPRSSPSIRGRGSKSP